MSGMDDAKQRILRAVSLEAVLADSLTLQSRSGRKVALCPFHNEKSPSFTIYDDHYFCFGCKAHGDAIDFLRQHSGMGFIEALKHLAKKFGVDAPELDANDKFSHQQKTFSRYYSAMQEAQKFFVQNLSKESTQSCSRYLQNRGFSSQDIQNFGFGLALDQWDALVQYLKSKSFKDEEIEAVGLSSRSQENQRSIDFFRHRIMIPIRDPQGRLIAFGGRTLGNHPAKYLNSRDTVLFSKSETLFGLDRARSFIRQRNRAILVEGYMDALAMQKFGFEECVACLGTAFTEAHLRKLSSLTSKVILLFDGDEAGFKASLKVLELGLKFPKLEISVASLPDNKDPDTFLQEFGKDSMQTILHKAEPLVDVAIHHELQSKSGTSILQTIKELMIPWLRQLSDPLQVSYLIHKIAQKSGVSSRELERQLQEAPKRESLESRLKNETSDNKEVTEPRFRKNFKDFKRWEKDFVAHLFLANPAEFEGFNWESIERADVAWTHEAKNLVSLLKQRLKDPGTKLSACEDEGFSYLLLDDDWSEALQKIKDNASAFDVGSRKVEMQKLINHAKKDKLKEGLMHLKSELNGALAKGNEGLEESKRILATIQELNRNLMNLGQNL